MKKKRLSYEEYNRLKQSLQGLSWTWQVYQERFPDGWYDFKYSPRLRYFTDYETEEVLLSHVRYRRFPKRVVLPKFVYNEIKELTTIHSELQDELDHPIDSRMYQTIAKKSFD